MAIFQSYVSLPEGTPKKTMEQVEQDLFGKKIIQDVNWVYIGFDESNLCRKPNHRFSMFFPI